jgi:superfamily I DNA and/or RNA helicase
MDGRCIVAVGDQNQLEPFSNVQDVWGSSGCRTPPRGFFQRVEEALRAAGRPVAMLLVQYRMHPHLCAFVSDNFYQGRLQTDPGVARCFLLIENCFLPVCCSALT